MTSPTGSMDTKKSQEAANPNKKKFTLPWSTVEAAVIRKDIVSIWGSMGTRFIILLIPIILVILVPIGFLVAISLMAVPPGEALPEGILAVLQPEVAELDYRAAMFTAFTQLLAPMFYLSVPIITSIAVASVSFVGEREAHTLETLMLTSLPAKTIFNAKIIASTILSVIISLFSFIAFSIVAIVGDTMLGAPGFFNFDWFIIVVLLTPGLAVFGAVFVSIMSARIRTTTESLQLMGYFVLVLALIYLMQFCGLYNISTAILLIVALMMIILDFILFNIAMKKFTPERMLTPTFIMGQIRKHE